ncbi:hypothetical protein ACP70R_031526 [Stipagrostis hirtigluma subsp. patula]
MRRGGRLPKSSLAPSAPAGDRKPSMDAGMIRNLEYDFSRRDSDAASLSSMGTAAPHSANPFSDRASQAAALRYVNAFLAPAIHLRPPLPAARDILAALRHLLDRLDYPLREKEVAFEDDLIFFLRQLGCPYKLTRSALKAPGTPHSWPPLLSVLHWLTVLAGAAENLQAAAEPPSNDLMLYTTQAYSHFIQGDDDSVAALDEEYVSRARTHAEAASEKLRAREKEAEELEAKRNKITSVPSQREALEAENAALDQDVKKFQTMVQTWNTKIKEKEEALEELGKALERQVMKVQRITAENEELMKKVEAQAVTVRDADRMRREMQAVENDIAQAENGKASLEEKSWELEAALVGKLEELEGLAEQCNQALKRLKPGIDFQFMLNAKGSSPPEIIGPSYKMVLKPALKAHAEETERDSVSKLEESVRLKKELQDTVKILEEKMSNISGLQAQTDKKAVGMICLSILIVATGKMKAPIIVSERTEQFYAYGLMGIMKAIREYPGHTVWAIIYPSVHISRAVGKSFDMDFVFSYVVAFHSLGYCCWEPSRPIKIVARVNSLDHFIANHDSRCTAEASRMKDELEKKNHKLSAVEKDANEYLKTSEQQLQEALHKADEEIQLRANELLQLVVSVTEHKEFMETLISGMKKDLYETADYIASLASKTLSTSQTS